MDIKVEHIIETLERDKQSIFLVLNENITQSLMALKLILQRAQEEKEEDETRIELIRTSKEYLDLALADLRNLTLTHWPYAVWNIRLPDTIRSLVYEITHNKPVSITWEVKEGKDERVSLTKRLLICRILEEQLRIILNCRFMVNISITFRIEGHQMILSIKDHIDHQYTRAPGYSRKLMAIKEEVEMFSGKFSLSFRRGMGNLLVVHIPT